MPLDGPLGPIPGGLKILELHSDGGTEDKLFAPGYGEFLTGGDGDLEALALGVPTDALNEPVPADRFGAALESAAATSLNTHLGAMQAAVIDGDLDAAAEAAAGLREVIAGIPAS